jgi:hypothetical protein
LRLQLWKTARNEQQGQRQAIVVEKKKKNKKNKTKNKYQLHEMSRLELKYSINWEQGIIWGTYFQRRNGSVTKWTAQWIK